ncbi:hypothetical protein [Microbacterium lacticum]
MRKLGIWEIVLVAVALTGCTATASPAASNSSTADASTPAPTSSPSATTVDPASVDWAQELTPTSDSVVSAESSADGDVSVQTTLTTAPEAGGEVSLSAMALCERAVALGATKVTIAADDGTALVVYGDPEYGDLCTEVPLAPQ